MTEPHRAEIVVRGYHLDFYGHVNNARYLEFLEEARWQWVEQNADLGHLLQEGIGFSVVNINIDYRRPGRLGDVLVIESRVTSVGARSAVLHQRVVLRDSGTVVADASVTFVLVSTESGRALPLDPELRRLIGV